MPKIVRVEGKVNVIDNCEFRAKIAIYNRSVEPSGYKFGVTLTKVCQCYAVYDNTGAGVPYFDRVSNAEAGITDYFFIKKTSQRIDKTCVVEYKGNRYNVKTMTDLGNYWRLNCSLNGANDKEGSKL